MREGLAREFPDAGRASAWARDRIGGGPAVWSEPIVWATISGIGAGFLAGAVAQALVSLTNEALQAVRGSSPFALFPVVTIVGSAAAAAIALRVGGLFPLALFVAYVALDVALGIPGVMMFCERSGGAGFIPLPGPNQCTAQGFLASLWPELVGIGLGVALSRAITARRAGVNSVLRVAGGYAVAQFVMGQVWAATIAQTAGPLTGGLTLAAGAASAAVAGGVIAAQLPRGVRSAAIVAAISLLPWLTFQLPNGLRSLASGFAPEFVVPVLVGVAIQPIAAAFLVLSAVVTSRARFVPRDTA